MARGDTLPPARKHFAEDDDGPVDTAPKRLRYPCVANQCPMPGVIFLGGAEDGVCGWHARENGTDWGRITRAIRDWECVSKAILVLRRVMTHPDTCASPKDHDRVMREQAGLIATACEGSDWHPRTAPLPKELIGQWHHRLTLFLGARVKEAITGAAPGSIDETKPTPFVAEVRAGLRATPLLNPED